MAHEGLIKLIIVALLGLSCVFTTLFPLTFLLGPWHKRQLGRVMMAQAIALALTLDFTLLFAFWQPAVNVKLAVNLVVFSILACTTGALYYKLFKHNIWKPLQEIRSKRNVR